MNRIARSLNVCVVLLGLLALLDGFAPARMGGGLWTVNERAVLTDISDRLTSVDPGHPDDTSLAILPGPAELLPSPAAERSLVLPATSAAPRGFPRGWPQPRASPSVS